MLITSAYTTFFICRVNRFHRGNASARKEISDRSVIPIMADLLALSWDWADIHNPPPRHPNKTARCCSARTILSALSSKASSCFFFAVVAKSTPYSRWSACDPITPGSGSKWIMAETASGNEDVLNIEEKFMVAVALSSWWMCSNLLLQHWNMLICRNAKYQNIKYRRCSVLASVRLPTADTAS